MGFTPRVSRLEVKQITLRDVHEGWASCNQLRSRRADSEVSLGRNPALSSKVGRWMDRYGIYVLM